MDGTTRIRVGFLGTGIMARHHLSQMLTRADTVVPAVCEPSMAAYDLALYAAFRRVPLPDEP